LKSSGTKIARSAKARLLTQIWLYDHLEAVVEVERHILASRSFSVEAGV
jgi:hypothetical protein